MTQRFELFGRSPIESVNPVEVTRSFHTYMNGYTPDFQALWGGFPPTPMTEEQAVTESGRRPRAVAS